ncbi:MAG: DUF1361 domain-containing protein [Bacteroidetes bacterium]|nr:DUF1361 domain-containing protein [Bacteroidota bacterium]
MNTTTSYYFNWHNRTIHLSILFFMSLFCFTISLIRALKTGTTTYLFLNWNLFLAALPILFSTLMLDLQEKQPHSKQIPLLFFAWLLFFPNAPYILTDFFHFKDRLVIPMWFDLGILLAFAWTGLLMGLKSLNDMEVIIRQRLGRTRSRIFITLLLFVCSFGVYLGRVVRWNSWEVITEPVGVLSDIATRIIFPVDHPRAWGMTILYGIILNMIYWSIRMLRSPEQLE